MPVNMKGLTDYAPEKGVFDRDLATVSARAKIVCGRLMRSERPCHHHSE